MNGHKGAVTALRYNKLGSMLASGGKDNDIILWDVVGETGLYRLRGHRDQVCITVFQIKTINFGFTGTSDGLCLLILLTSLLSLTLQCYNLFSLFHSCNVGD